MFALNSIILLLISESIFSFKQGMRALWVFVVTHHFYDIQNNKPGFKLDVIKKKKIKKMRCQTLSRKIFFLGLQHHELNRSRSNPLISSPSYFHRIKGKLRLQSGSDIIERQAWYCLIKCITLIKSIKETNKRQTVEKWGYWSEVLHKWLSLGANVNRHVAHSRTNRIQAARWQVTYLSCGDALNSLPKMNVWGGFE